MDDRKFSEFIYFSSFMISVNFPDQLVITTQIVLFYTLINIGFEHFLRSNKPN